MYVYWQTTGVKTRAECHLYNKPLTQRGNRNRRTWRISPGKSGLTGSANEVCGKTMALMPLYTVSGDDDDDGVAFYLLPPSLSGIRRIAFRIAGVVRDYVIPRILHRTPPTM